MRLNGQAQSIFQGFKDVHEPFTFENSHIIQSKND